MRPAATPVPPALPAPVRALLAERGVDAEALRERDKLGLRRPVVRLGAPGLVVELALGEAGRVRIRREVWGRRWASGVGLATAAVVGADPDGSWLVSEWVEAAPPTGPSYLDRAVEAALALAQAPPPPPGPPANVWRSPRRAALARTGRALAARMPVRLWWAARAAARSLPWAPVAHGDFYHRNALWRPDHGQVCLVDWEYLGPAPRHGDLLRMWTVLPGRADRDALLERIFAAVPASQHREVAALGLWLALRLLGENVKAARRDRDAADTAHAWSIQAEARELAEAHDAWPL